MSPGSTPGAPGAGRQFDARVATHHAIICAARLAAACCRAQRKPLTAPPSPKFAGTVALEIMHGMHISLKLPQGAVPLCGRSPISFPLPGCRARRA
jgi:hypothetical protein